jgi:hypothetical protein
MQGTMLLEMTMPFFGSARTGVHNSRSPDSTSLVPGNTQRNNS